MNKKLWIILIILIVLAVIIGSFAFFYKKPGETKQSEPIVKQIKLTDFVSEEEAKSWQTYKDDEFGFEFRYPKGWNVHIGDYYTNKKIIGLNPNGVEGGSQIMLEVAWNKNGGGFLDSFSLVKNFFSYFSNKISIANVIINGLESEDIDIYLDFLFSKVLFFQRDGLSYTFQMISANKDLFYPILSTFKFTGDNLSRNNPPATYLNEDNWIPSKFVSSNQNKDWKVYKDDKYGFEISYPSEWVIERKNDYISFVGDYSIYDQVSSEYYDDMLLHLSISKKDSNNPDDQFSNEFSRYINKIFIGGKNWLSYYNNVARRDGFSKEVFTLIEDGYVFNIYRGAVGDTYKDSLFIDLLSTFKFTK